MKTLPEGLTAYSRTPEFTETRIPRGLLREHSTKAGVWGRIVIESGALTYRIIESGEVVELSPRLHGVVEPEVLHEVSPRGKVRFWVEFLKKG